MKAEYPDFIYAADAPLRAKPSVYPPMLADRVKGREKRPLGDVFGLTNYGKTQLSPGMCAGFKAGTSNPHSLINETAEDVLYLEIGDRTDGDEVSYPDDDLCAKFANGAWAFFRKDGTPY